MVKVGEKTPKIKKSKVSNHKSLIMVQCWLMQGHELDGKTQSIILWTKWPIGALVGASSLWPILIPTKHWIFPWF
jgi:hypothetical protein